MGLVPYDGSFSLAIGDGEHEGRLFVNAKAKDKKHFDTAKAALEAAVESGECDELTVTIDKKQFILAEALTVPFLAMVWQSEGYAPGWKPQLWTTKAAKAENAAYLKRKGKKRKAAKPKARTKKKALPLF